MFRSTHSTILRGLTCRTLCCYLLTYLLTPWSRVLLEKLTSKLQLVKKFPAFTEPESSSPYPQVPATCPYPQPTPSCPHDPLQLPEDPSQYYPLIYVLVSAMTSFPQASPPTPCAQLYPPPYAPYALPISFVSILPPAQYCVRSTDHSLCAFFCLCAVTRQKKYIYCTLKIPDSAVACRT